MCDMTHLRAWHACLVSVTKLFVCLPWLSVCLPWLSVCVPWLFVCVTWLFVWTLDSTGKKHSQWRQNVNESVNQCFCQWECFCQKAKKSMIVFLPKSTLFCQRVNESVSGKKHSQKNQNVIESVIESAFCQKSVLSHILVCGGYD